VPTVAELFSLAVQHHRAGNLQLAERLYKQVIGLSPNYAEAHSNLGAVLADQGKLDEAVTHFHQALHIRPRFPEAHTNLGNALARLEKLDEAAVNYRDALGINPNMADAHNGLGCVLERYDQLDEAIRCFQEAIRLKPNLAQAHNNLGNALTRQDRLDEGIGCCREALRLKPNFPEAHTNLGRALLGQNKLDEASRCFHEALRLDSGFAPARWNHSLLSLLRGEFEQGWADYEWRWALPGKARPQFAQPRWDGSELNGRSILLHAEQGLGDTLQFIRYVPLVIEHGGRVIVACQPALLPLLAGAGKGSGPVCPNGPEVLSRKRLVSRDSPLPPFDVQAPLLSLPGIMHTALATIPATVPYLRADDELVEHWRRELRKSRKSEVESPKSEVRSPKSEEVQLTSDFRLPTSDFLVGIAWQGSPTHRYDRQRSIPFAHFARLAEVPGVQLISLQKGPGSQLDEASGAFMDTAAVMMNLDLVISCDTAVPHLAGALGIPAWVALPLVPDWRWLLQRQDSPWYPTMRLFRQTRPGTWEDVFDRIIEDLKAVVSCQKTNS